MCASTAEAAACPAPATLQGATTSLRAKAEAAAHGSRFTNGGPVRPRQRLAHTASKPADRAFVLNAIREAWGSEQAFETYVRNELPAIMEQSKAAYKQQLSNEIVDSLEMVLGCRQV